MGFFEDRDDLGPPPEQFRLGRDGNFRSPVPLKWIGLAAGIVILLVVLNEIKSIYVDFLWFDSVGDGTGDSYAGVFRERIIAQILLFLLGAVITGAVVGINIWLARRYAPVGPEESFIEDVDPVAIRRIVAVGLVAGTIFLAVVFGAVARSAWETILSWQNGVSFGREDPTFNRDISFYLFDLPAYHFLQSWALSLLIVSALAAGSVYLLSYSLQGFELRIPKGMRVHLSVLGGLVLLMFALGTYLSIFDLATSASGIVTGATYTDVNARLPVRYILVALGVFAGLATIANALISTGWRVPVFAVGVWIAVAIFGGFFYPAGVQSFQVDPNELEKEEKYIDRNIRFTRLAWGLGEIEVQNFTAAPAVTAQEVADNPATIENIRLLDPRPTLDTFRQEQALRPLYTFVDVDVDRYEIDGAPEQVMLSARELDLSQARETEGSGWTQQRLQFTHGFGAVVAPVNRTTSEGLPTFLTQDIPPRPADSPVPISEEGSRVYFGELTSHYIIVKTNEPEFDYPSGTEIVETTYEPDRGIALSNIFRRAALAWDLGDFNILISGQLDSDSRLLMHRTIDDRIRKVAPFLTLDPDPYLVVENEQLFWIQDAYTTASDFPYSDHLNGVNYIRNSVKVVVDAITGDMTFYLIDSEDPVAATWDKIFPDLFTSDAEMPEWVREHLRYPELLFRLQAEQYLTYHIQNPRVFFQAEDLWNIPREKFRQQEQDMEPYYVIMTLPNETQEEFALILPFTPAGTRQNAIAWIAGRADGENYGKLRDYRLPTDLRIFGPAQIEARIDQDPGISQQLTLWDTAGSEVIRGNLLMIPIGQSFLYVEPIYLQAATSRLPELARVVVANGDDIAMECTFAEALDVIFDRSAPLSPGSECDTTVTPPVDGPGDDDGDGETPIPDRLRELIEEAGEAADAAQSELDRLREILEDIGALEE